MINWIAVRRFVHRQSFFCAMGVIENGAVRLFPIGSLKFAEDGTATYFELYARPTEEGTPLSCLAVNLSPWFWIRSLLKGKFEQPPGLRLQGEMGPRQQATEAERARFHRAVGWLRWTKGGRTLWPDAKYSRVVRFHSVQPLLTGKMTRGLEHWAQV